MADHDIDLPASKLGDALVEAVALSRQCSQRIPSLVSLEALSPVGSVGSTPAPTPRRNTMALPNSQANPISIAGFNDEQFRQILELVGHQR